MFNSIEIPIEIWTEDGIHSENLYAYWPNFTFRYFTKNPIGFDSIFNCFDNVGTVLCALKTEIKQRYEDNFGWLLIIQSLLKRNLAKWSQLICIYSLRLY